MSIRNEKEKIISEIQNLRTMLLELDFEVKSKERFFDDKWECQTQLNKIQDMVFGL